MTVSKDLIKRTMLGHLTAKGYPKMTRHQILAEVKALWVLLEETPGALQPGMTFKVFRERAEQAAYGFANGSASGLSDDDLEAFIRAAMGG